MFHSPFVVTCNWLTSNMEWKVSSSFSNGNFGCWSFECENSWLFGDRCSLETFTNFSFAIDSQPYKTRLKPSFSSREIFSTNMRSNCIDQSNSMCPKTNRNQRPDQNAVATSNRISAIGFYCPINISQFHPKVQLEMRNYDGWYCVRNKAARFLPFRFVKWQLIKKWLSLHVSAVSNINE